MAPNWELLFDETSLLAVLPSKYAYFARPIRDALAIFLGGLCEADQNSILRAQASLPPNASIAERLGTLARNSPVLHKLGQILARDKRLSLDLRRQLSQLESLPPTISLATIQDMLTQELGPLDRRGVTLMPSAIAEASVAVVIPFEQDTRNNGSRTARDATSTDEHVDRTRGVFKILKPGIEERLEHELGLLQRVGEYLDERCDELRIPHLNYQESFQQVREKLSDEVRLENEQRHLAQAQEFYADEPQVQIPHLFDHCTSRVTAMTRISGGKVTDHGLSCRSKRRRLASLIARTMIAKPIYSRNDQVLFHSDPHAGNLFLTTDNRLAILDWSLVGSLGADERTAIVQVMLGAITLDSRRINRLLTQLSHRQVPDAKLLDSIVEAWVRRIRRGAFPGFSWLIGMLDDAVQNARLRLRGDLMLFRKTLHMLEGVLGDVGESGQIDEVLCTEFLRHFAIEWPQRWLQLPNSRDYATRLANFDLAHIVLSGPRTIGRFWTGHAADAMAAYTRTGESASHEAASPRRPPVNCDESTINCGIAPQIQTETLCPSNV